MCFSPANSNQAMLGEPISYVNAQTPPQLPRILYFPRFKHFSRFYAFHIIQILCVRFISTTGVPDIIRQSFYQKYFNLLTKSIVFRTMFLRLCVHSRFPLNRE